MVDIFDLHKSIVDDYSNYIKSFINIKDERITRKVHEELENGRLWPDPLIQINPSYKVGEKLSDLCSQGLLHPELGNIFTGYELYEHQVEALKLGVADKDFIVTSGTGSGKSLTYFGTIFNHLFNHNQFGGNGIKAIIVYPMNPLVNSQLEEIERYKKNYLKETGKEFPFTCRRYTGQEKADEKEEVKELLPDIILTNYMMLELLLTRISEEKLRSSIKQHLKYLVFDELHTYRGRQGADVAMLIRKLRSMVTNEVVCIGTSATMVTGDSIKAQKEKVAKVASNIFGKSYTPSQVINEKLQRV